MERSDAEDVLVEFEGGRDVFDGDPDMGDRGSSKWYVGPMRHGMKLILRAPLALVTNQGRTT